MSTEVVKRGADERSMLPQGKGKKSRGLNRVLYATSITWRLDALTILLPTIP